MKKKYFQPSTLIIFIICLFVMMPHFVFAITLDRASYYPNEPIIISDCSGAPIVLYNIDSGEVLFGSAGCNPGQDLNDGSLNISINYSIIEMSTDVGCYAYGLTYNECKNTPDFISEANFTILPMPFSGGEVIMDEEVEVTLSGIISHRPEVKIILPGSGSMFSSEGLIKYEAVDKNDSLGGESKARLGMSSTPVSIYYSDTITEWDHSLVKDEDKIFIIKDLEAVSSYLWKTKGLVEGKLYRVIVDAIDGTGAIGEAVSEFFGVDFTPPTFIVSTIPQIAKNEDVRIYIKASEDLSSPPEVFVKQNKADSIKIEMVGSGKDYEGIYSVKNGYDGMAKIMVTGQDIASNKGNVIVGGGTFSVGVNPPRKPEISFPKENERVNSDKITVIGTTRADTEIIAIINGVETYKSLPDEEGNFIIKDIVLKSDITNGINIINIVSKDLAGITSESEIIHVSFNSAPSISILTPEDNSIISATSTINIKTTDNNGDKLSFTYQITQIDQDIEDEDWQTILLSPSEKIVFDSTEFNDGNYFLRVLVDDGATTTISNLTKIRIKNDLPYIRFTDGRSTTVSGNIATIQGSVMISPSALFSYITRFEYSINSGKSWILVSSQDGVWDSSEERFSVTLKNLKNGKNDILWKATDSRGIIAKAKHPVVVDSQAPNSPVILFPENNQILTENDNQSDTKEKFNFTLYGKSELKSKIVVELEGKQYTAKTLYDGTFKIQNISLNAKGKHLLRIYATDEANNKSKIIEKTIIYNNPPKIVFTSPRDGRGVGGDIYVSWLANDIDGDSLSTALSYRALGEKFIELPTNEQQNKFNWHTKELEEGKNYELRLEVSDGIATSTTYASFVVDRSLPSVLEMSLDKTVYGKNDKLIVNGMAMDDGSGVEYVEYRFQKVDETENTDSSVFSWYKATIKNGFLKNRAEFLINNSFVLKSGEYRIILRAVDASGNISKELSETIFVDDIPPRVGGFEVTSGGINFLPNDRMFSAVIGEEVSIKLSLEADTKNAYLKYNQKIFKLDKDLATGLWNTRIIFEETGKHSIFVFANDIFGNQLVDKLLTNFIVENRGKVKSLDKNGLESGLIGAKIIITQVNEDTGFWSFINPKKTLVTETDNNGEYTVLLPAGVYEIWVEKDGYKKSEKEKIVIENNAFVNKNISLEEDLNTTSFWGEFIKMSKYNK